MFVGLCVCVPRAAHLSWRTLSLEEFLPKYTWKLCIDLKANYMLSPFLGPWHRAGQQNLVRSWSRSIGAAKSHPPPKLQLQGSVSGTIGGFFASRNHCMLCYVLEARGCDFKVSIPSGRTGKRSRGWVEWWCSQVLMGKKNACLNLLLPSRIFMML